MVRRVVMIGMALLLAGMTACGIESLVGKGVTTVSITMSEYGFEPEKIIVPSGAEITVTLTNSGQREHDLTIMAEPATAPFDADDVENIYWQTALPGGGEEVVVFTAPAAPGEYDLVSSLPGDLEAGMIGTLLVVMP